MLLPGAAKMHYTCVMFVRILQGLVEVSGVCHRIGLLVEIVDSKCRRSRDRLINRPLPMPSDDKNVRNVSRGSFRERRRQGAVT